MEPLLLEPYYVSPIWGGPRIAQARGIPWTDGDCHGEAFDVSAHPTTMGVVRNGPCAGMTLADAIAARHAEILGNVDDDAPLQVTFMDAAQTLSVQVHPDETYAQKAEGDHGKIESWYILEAGPNATLIQGCTTNDVDALRVAAADDSIGKRYGNFVEVQAGDFVFIPTGTLHALGAGILAVEIASLGNTTYRICDWGRGRELHVSKAFDVLRTENRPGNNHMGAFDPTLGTRERLGMDGGFFKSFVIDVCESCVHHTTEGRYAVITCVEGTVVIETPDGSASLRRTESCLIPADAECYTIRGVGRVLRSIRTPKA